MQQWPVTVNLTEIDKCDCVFTSGMEAEVESLATIQKLQMKR